MLLVSTGSKDKINTKNTHKIMGFKQKNNCVSIGKHVCRESLPPHLIPLSSYTVMLFLSVL